MNKEIINQPRAIKHSLLLGLSDTPLSIGATLFIEAMKLIPLTQGQFAQVDDEDYDFLNQFKWHTKRKGNNYYARRMTPSIRKFVYMHRSIMDAPFNMQIDHIDRNGLNNQKNNLRYCTRHQNSMNKTSFSVTGYLGVCFDRGYIKANICVNSKHIHLGNFKTLEEAARARDIASIKYFGEFASLNFPSHE